MKIKNKKRGRQMKNIKELVSKIAREKEEAEAKEEIENLKKNPDLVSDNRQYQLVLQIYPISKSADKRKHT